MGLTERNNYGFINLVRSFSLAYLHATSSNIHSGEIDSDGNSQH